VGCGGGAALRFATHFTAKARGGREKECGSSFLYKTDPEKTNELPKLDFGGEFPEERLVCRE
jgi:hypothetical protein